MDFWWIFSAKLRAKLIKKSIIWALVGQLPEIAKKLKKNVFQCFLVARPPNFEGNLAKDPPQTHQKSIKKLDQQRDAIYDRFLEHLGSILEGFWKPRWLQNRRKIDQKTMLHK